MNDLYRCYRLQPNALSSMAEIEKEEEIHVRLHWSSNFNIAW